MRLPWLVGYALVLGLVSCVPEGSSPGYGGGDDDDDDDVAAGLEGTLEKHNEIRAAHGVGPMTWSTALALTAQSWAEECHDGDGSGLIDHNPNRSVGHPYGVGENVFGGTGPYTGVEATEYWASEEADYDYETNTCSSVCGHYTQIVWADSIHLGCGIHHCPALTFGYVVVCNYGPAGNYEGEWPY
jgi:pathogenesis-related protein 1